jgi:hypothetical protein
MMENLTDTVLNICVFVFVAVLLWLYFKEFPEDGGVKSANMSHSDVHSE